MIDLYTILGVPLRITMGYPSASGPDAKADSDMKVSAGSWRAGFSPEAQAQWAAEVSFLLFPIPSIIFFVLGGWLVHAPRPSHYPATIRSRPRG